MNVLNSDLLAYCLGQQMSSDHIQGFLGGLKFDHLPVPQKNILYNFNPIIPGKYGVDKAHWFLRSASCRARYSCYGQAEAGAGFLFDPDSHGCGHLRTDRSVLLNQG